MSNKAASIRLSQVAPWSDGHTPALRNSYRDRFTQAGGRFYKVSAQSLNDIWSIEEITQDGDPMILHRPTDAWAPTDEWVFGYVDIAFTLTEAREKIAQAASEPRPPQA